MMTPRRFFIFIFLSLIFFQGYSQQSARARRILENLQRFEQEYPQQKVFLHLDREEYVAGENIWFKAYLLQANNHVPDTSSTSLNVEFHDINGKSVALQLIRMQDGLGYGQIILPDSLPEGNYKLISYSNWMKNFSESLFFERDIFVHNPIEENFIRRSDLRQNINFNEELEEKKAEIQLGIFPEGGQLVAGVDNRVAFYAADGTGSPLGVSGRVMDNTGQTLANIQTVVTGMGVFSLTPQSGQSYSIELEVPGKGSQTFSMPEAVQQAYALRVDLEGNEVNVRVQAGFNPGALNLPGDLIIIAQSQGKAFYIQEGSLENESFSTTFFTDRLPTGITQITVFDANATPVAERLIFVNHQDQIQPELDVNTIRLGNENGLQVEFNLDFDQAGDEWAHLSMAVEGADQPFEKTAANILTEILIRSDLDIGVPDLQEIFPGNKYSSERIDLVMMTHGWRRFEWKDILAGNFPPIQFTKPRGHAISGQLNSVNAEQLSANVLLEITIVQEGREVYTTRTNERGFFSLEGLDYNGYFTAEFRLPDQNRPRGFSLRVDGTETTPRSFSMNAITQPVSVLKRSDDWKRVPSPDVFAVVSKAREIARESKSLYGAPDQTIFMDEVSVNYSNVLEVFRGKATGVSFVGNSIVIRGEGSIGSSNEPLFLLDGVVVTPEVLLNMRPTELDRIEILKGPNTAIFGARGANGVIIAYSRQGSGQDPVFEYHLLGFATPREFFNSRIHLNYKRENEISHTIFWEPGIMPDEQGRFGMGFPVREQWKHTRIILQGIHSSGKLIWSEFYLD